MDVSTALLILCAFTFGGGGYWVGLRVGLRYGQLIILNALPSTEREPTLRRAAELLKGD